MHNISILFLYSGTINPQKGGVQRVTFDLSDYLANMGATCFYLSLKKNSESLDERQYYLPESYKFNTSKNRDYLVRFLLENRIDVLINQSGISPDCSELAYVAVSINVKLISCIHNSLLDTIRNFNVFYQEKFKRYHLSYFLKFTKNKLSQKVLLSLYKWKYQNHYKRLHENSDKIVLLSETHKEDLAFFVNTFSPKVIAIPNPIPKEYELSNVNNTNKEKIVLYVGRVDCQYKRADLLLDIWSLASKEHKDWKLKIVGGGPELERVKSYAKKLGLCNVYFEGFQNPLSYYEEASVFCMTSVNEGFGIVLVEAMKMGVVPIAFDSYSSVRDIIDDGINGLLVSPFNIEEYSSVLSSLMDNGESLNRFSNNARKKAESFSIQLIGEKWMELLEKS